MVTWKYLITSNWHDDRGCLILIVAASMMSTVSVYIFQGGIYLFQLVDWYTSAFALLLGSALEGIIVCWIYGKLCGAYIRISCALLACYYTLRQKIIFACETNCMSYRSINAGYIELITP